MVGPSTNITQLSSWIENSLYTKASQLIIWLWAAPLVPPHQKKETKTEENLNQIKVVFGYVYILLKLKVITESIVNKDKS